MQGFNMGRYYPPDSSSSSATGALTFNKSHPLGARARKLKTQGILTVRFEMPFAIWCGTCPKPTIIGQGVRFNAEKKKVGNYHSTPIWSFRIKHAACGGAIEIRTDPKATEYVVVEGAKRRDYGDDARTDEDEGGLGLVLGEEERARRREDAMTGLEGKRDEQLVKKESGRRIEQLLEERSKWWDDPYAASSFVRKGFRRERKERHREAGKAEEIQSRLGLDVALLPASAEDEQRARLIEFAPALAADAVAKPLFPESDARHATKKQPLASGKMTTRAGKAQAQSKEDLRQSLRSGTRLATDPFIVGSRPSEQGTAAAAGHQKLRSIVRKREWTPAASVEEASSTITTTMPPALVAYDSD